MPGKNHLSVGFIFIIILVIALTGCSTSAQNSEQPTAVATSTVVEPTPLPTNTPVPPTDTATPLPLTATFTATFTPLPSDTPTPEPMATETPPPPTPSGNDAIYIYLIQTNTGGPVACGDSLIKVNTGLWRTGDNAADIATALRKLFVKSQYIAGLYNPIYLSNMTVVSTDFNPNTGYATVDFTGTYVRSGDRCDDGRVHDQIWTTIRQFPGVKGNPMVRLDGNLVGDILSTAPGREKPKKP